MLFNKELLHKINICMICNEELLTKNFNSKITKKCKSNLLYENNGNHYILIDDNCCIITYNSHLLFFLQ